MVVANIVADVILRLTGKIDAFLEKDAVYLMSGIIDTRAEEVKAALNRAGFALWRNERKGAGWLWPPEKR